MTIRLLERCSNMKLLYLTKRMIAGNLLLHRKFLFEYEIQHGKVRIKIFGSSNKNKFLYESTFCLRTKQRKPIPGNRLRATSKAKRTYGRRQKSKTRISKKSTIVNKWITPQVWDIISQLR